jgi:hypothetical protein
LRPSYVGNAKSPELPLLPSTAGDDVGFLKELALAVKLMRHGLVRAIADGPAVAISSFASTATVQIGWNWVTGCMTAFALQWLARLQASEIDRTQYTAASYSAQRSDSAVQAMSHQLNQYGASPLRAEIMRKRAIDDRTFY